MARAGKIARIIRSRKQEPASSECPNFETWQRAAILRLAHEGEEDMREYSILLDGTLKNPKFKPVPEEWKVPWIKGDANYIWLVHDFEKIGEGKKEVGPGPRELQELGSVHTHPAIFDMGLELTPPYGSDPLRLGDYGGAKDPRARCVAGVSEGRPEIRCYVGTPGKWSFIPEHSCSYKGPRGDPEVRKWPGTESERKAKDHLKEWKKMVSEI